ncbi:MAG: hypothetical protein R3246_06500 [Acidimicrobiia bacterium]|nr:hypothetical protein [Acidimicrobiia bacterium]
MPFAHTTWFTEERPEYDWGFLLEPTSLALVGIAIAVTIGWRLAGRRLPRPELPVLQPLGRLAPWIPRLLAIHAGVSLIAQAYDGTYLAPGLDLPTGTTGTVLAIVEGALGVWLVSGWKIRLAAVLLTAAGPLGLLAYDAVAILERVDLLGIALFLAFLPPGADRHGAAEVHPARLQVPMFLMRLGGGGALVVLAGTEKLIRPEIGLALIDRYPILNVATSLGFDITDLEFIRIAGAIELLFGLLVISGALPQIAVLVAGIPFNATLFFFGASELIGHLPIYGVMLAMLVYGSSPTHASAVTWLPGRIQTK